MIGTKITDYLTIWTKSILNPKNVWSKVVSEPTKKGLEFYKISIFPSEEIISSLSNVSEYVIKATQYKKRFSYLVLSIYLMLFLIFTSLSAYFLAKNDWPNFIGSIGIAIAIAPVFVYIFSYRLLKNKNDRVY